MPCGQLDAVRKENLDYALRLSRGKGGPQRLARRRLLLPVAVEAGAERPIR